MVEVSHLTKYFGRTAAVADVTFSVRPGEIVGFLGPNGAGKSTTMRMLSGYIPATGGTARIAGFDVFRESLEVRRRIGYLPENVRLYTEMRVAEYLKYRGRLKGLRGKRLRGRLGDVLESCGLADVRRKIIGTLSKGYCQRVGLADSLIHEPEVLILDEPTIGLDPNQIRHIRGLIRSLARKHTILLSSHILPEIEMICERVLIMNQGRIVASDTPANLAGLMQGDVRVFVEIRGDPEGLTAALQSVAGVKRVTCEPAGGEWHRFICLCEKGSEVSEGMYELAARNHWALRALGTEERKLEDVFAAITANAGPAGTGDDVSDGAGEQRDAEQTETSQQ